MLLPLARQHCYNQLSQINLLLPPRWTCYRRGCAPVLWLLPLVRLGVPRITGVYPQCCVRVGAGAGLKLLEVPPEISLESLEKSKSLCFKVGQRRRPRCGVGAMLAPMIVGRAHCEIAPSGCCASRFPPSDYGCHGAWYTPVRASRVLRLRYQP